MSDHAGRMDAVYRTQRHFYDLTRKYYLLGRDALIRDLAPPPQGTVLEIGCGTGRNLIAAAHKWPTARFYGLDISEAMLDTARLAVARARLTDRITLAQGDATDFDAEALFGLARFDRVFMSYTLSMIPGWQDAVSQAMGLGRRLHIVDFGQQEEWPAIWRRLLFAWLRHFHVTPRAELHHWLRQRARDQAMLLDFRPRFGGYAWAATVRRH